MRTLCLRHVRAPIGGCCQGKPNRGNVYIRWRPRLCAPKKGAIIGCSLRDKRIYIGYRARRTIGFDTVPFQPVAFVWLGERSLHVLANRSFIHLIIPKNQPISIPIRPIIDIINRKQDLFAYITIKRYTYKEFYGVIINIGASKKSTIGYRQYLIYKTTINNNIDINTI